jgi:hypothetical protein
VSGTSRTQRLTELTDTPTRLAISLTESPSRARPEWLDL